MKPETRTKIKIGDTIIDAEDLNEEEKTAFIEFAIHLAAPSIAKRLIGSKIVEAEKKTETTEHDDLIFQMPPTLTVQEVADYLRVSKTKIYDMCRIYHGKFFPCFRIGNRIKIPRDRFIEWLNSGGMEYYEKQVAAEDENREKSYVKKNVQKE